MSKAYTAALASSLLAASLTFGQAPDAKPAPDPAAVAAPSANCASDGCKPNLLTGSDSKDSRVFSADMEFLLWFFGSSRGNFVVDSTAPLGAAGAGTVLGIQGDGERNGGIIPGARLTLGYWRVEDNPWIPGGIRDLGVETTFLLVSQSSADFVDNHDPTMVRPFYDLNNSQESGFLVAAPGVASGNIYTHGQANIWGAEANIRKNVYYDSPGTSWTVDFLCGFRFLSADDQLQLGSFSDFSSTIAPTSPYASLAGDKLSINDSFTTHNQFYGAQIGIDSKSWFFDKLCVEVGFKLAFGITAEELNTTGSQVLTLPNGTTKVSNAGLFALGSNIGHFDRDKFSPIPELTFKISAPLTEHWTLSTTFSALYWDRMLRAGLQVQRQLDITQIPNFPGAVGATPTGLGSPGVPFVQSELFMMSAAIGLEFRW